LTHGSNQGKELDTILENQIDDVIKDGLHKATDFRHLLGHAHNFSAERLPYDLELRRRHLRAQVRRATM